MGTTEEGGGQPLGLPPATGLATLGIYYYALYTFAEALQGVVASGVCAAVPSCSLYTPLVKVATLSLLQIRFACRLDVYWDLPTIWEEVAQGNVRTEGLAILNQVLMQEL